MVSVKTLFSTSVVVRKVQGYASESWGMRLRYGMTISECAVHCRYRIAALSSDCSPSVMSEARVTGGIFIRGGMAGWLPLLGRGLLARFWVGAASAAATGQSHLPFVARTSKSGWDCSVGAGPVQLPEIFRGFAASVLRFADPQGGASVPAAATWGSEHGPDRQVVLRSLSWAKQQNDQQQRATAVGCQFLCLAAAWDCPGIGHRSVFLIKFASLLCVRLQDVVYCKLAHTQLHQTPDESLLRRLPASSTSSYSAPQEYCCSQETS